MSRRDRSTRSTGPGARRQEAGNVVSLPHGIELELVGIIGPAGGIPGVEGVESLFLDGDEDLRALVESLRGAVSEPAACGRQDFDGGITLNDPPLN